MSSIGGPGGPGGKRPNDAIRAPDGPTGPAGPGAAGGPDFHAPADLAAPTGPATSATVAGAIRSAVAAGASDGEALRASVQVALRELLGQDATPEFIDKVATAAAEDPVMAGRFDRILRGLKTES